MAERAAEVAQLLLREGALRSDDPDHVAVREELLGQAELYDDVRLRLLACGYRLVQRLGHIGVAPDPAAHGGGPMRNRMGLNAAHVRLIVYLWTHLVYREWNDLRRHGRATAAPGTQQAALTLTGSVQGVIVADEAPSIGYAHVRAELSEVMSAAQLKAILRALTRLRFVRHDEKRDRIWADAGLYTLIDFERMEDFVVDLARRLGSDDPAAAVSAVARGSAVDVSEADEP